MRLSIERSIFLLIIVAALALRWWRLDLISFRYDAAEVMFRARETLHTGLPLTGIINSLGFHNAPGFIWALLPAAIFTPRPDIVTGWMGLLTTTALWPLWRLSRRFSPIGWWIPCLLYAAMPATVFAGRNLWAQCLVPAMAAWVWLWIAVAIDSTAPPTRRANAAMAALAMAAAAASVHLAALLYLALLAPIALWVLAKGSRETVANWTEAKPSQLHKSIAAPTILALLAFASLVPSALDYFQKRNAPTSKQLPHIQKFESLMPDPKPLAGRLSDSIGGQFTQFRSTELVLGAWAENEARLLRYTITCADLALLILFLAGLATTLLHLRGLRQSCTLHQMVILGIFLPGLIAGMLVPRINATYLAMSVPLLLLLPMPLYERVNRITRGVVTVSLLLLATVFVWFNLAALNQIDRTRFVNGPYYIPLADQQATAAKLAGAQVSPSRLVHLSGEWFQRPYDYLLKEVARAPELTRHPQWAVMEDANLRSQQPSRRDFITQRANLQHGSVRAMITNDAAKADHLVNEYYAIPIPAEASPSP